MGGVLVPFWKLRSAIAYRHAAPLGRRCRCSLQPLPDAALTPPACFPPSPLVLLSRSCCRSRPPLPQPPLTTCRSLGDLHGFSQCFRLSSSHRWPSVWSLASPPAPRFFGERVPFMKRHLYIRPRSFQGVLTDQSRFSPCGLCDFIPPLLGIVHR